MTTPENLGSAERIINTLLTYNDHAVHNRPGIVNIDGRTTTGVRWAYATHKVEEGKKIAYRLDKVGKKTTKVKVGEILPTGKITEGGREVGEYRPAGLFPETVAWFYKNVADVWKLDNEFAARWASYAYGQEHRDLKVVLAAFLLVQSRKGDIVCEVEPPTTDPLKHNMQLREDIASVLDTGKLKDRRYFLMDEDYRDVGEAMLLLRRKDGKDLNPKLILRVREILALPQIAAINRELGFGKSARNPFFGRWHTAVTKWLLHREENPKLLEGLVKAGFRRQIIKLCQLVGYKPESPKFFQALRWKQYQSKQGHRTMAIGEAVAAAETWEGMTETEVCERIVRDRVNFKRIPALLPKAMGLTRAIVAASIEVGGFSEKDLICFTPTLEELGLLEVQEIKEKWERAIKNAEDTRAANVATRVKSKDVAEKLVEAADNAVKTAVAEVMKDMRVYFMVDRSGSMEGAIAKAKEYIAKFLQAFPPDKIHVSHFNTMGLEVRIQHPSAAGVENAFRGVTASGGTSYGAGVVALQQHKPKDNEDVIFIFVGDEEASEFSSFVRNSGLRPMAFGFVKVGGETRNGTFGARFDAGTAVRATATHLGIPCFMISEETFSDPYAIPRTIRALVSATPVTQNAAPRVTAPRVTLAEQISKVPLLTKPVWA